MDDMNFCQSCGMPMKGNENLFGTNTDGSKNEEYCIYCFKDGAFIADMTMNEMIEFSVPNMVKMNKDMTEEKARQMMQEFFPELKRWKSNKM